MMASRSILALLLLTALPLRAADTPYINPFLPPRPATDQPLRLLQHALSQNDYPTAASTLHDLCANRDAPLLPTAEACWLSPQTWLATLPDAQRTSLRDAYRARFDPDARAAFDSLQANPASTPEDFARLAAQHPLSSIAPDAYAAAADRAVRLADPWTAVACYTLAQQANLPLRPQQLQNLDASRRLIATSPSPHPLPFDAIWYHQPDAIAQPRYFPLLANNTLYLAGPRDLFALTDAGAIAWTWNLADKNPRPLPRGQDRGRGPLFQPAALVSPAGPQILLARQRRPDSADYVLRAFRAADGHLLWSTDDHAALQPLCFAATPALAGRYVYALAKDYSQSPHRILLLALNLTDGRPLWQTTLGTLPNPTQRTTRARRDEDEESSWGWDDFYEQSEPAVADDLLLLSPNVGHLLALDRFTGQLRWIRSYPKTRPAEFAGDRPAPRVLPPADPIESLRWRNTPAVANTIALFAPQDTPSTFAVQTTTGNLLWSTNALSGFTLLGTTPAPDRSSDRSDSPPPFSAGPQGRALPPAATPHTNPGESLALFAGPTLQSINITTHQSVWTYRPPKNQPITGPSTLINAHLYIPTPTGLVTLSAATGSPTAAPPLPNLTTLARSDKLRPILERADIAYTFDLPEPDALKIGNQLLKLPTGPVPPAIADAFATFAPGWRLANCGPQHPNPLLKEYLGRSPVFVTHPVDANTPCSIARILRLPKDRRLALKLRVTHAPNSDWRLVVKVNGKTELDRIIDRASTGDNWFRTYVELAPYAGQQVLLELQQHPTTWTNESAYWAPLTLENR